MTGERRRDVFPLPSVGPQSFEACSGSSHRGLPHDKHSRRALKTANQAILALNHLGGRGVFRGQHQHPPRVATITSERVASQVLCFEKALSEIPTPQDALSPLMSVANSAVRRLAP